MARKKEISDRYMAYLLTQETSAVEQNSSSRDGKKEDRKEEVTEVSMKLCLVFVCQDVILWSFSMKERSGGVRSKFQLVTRQTR